MTYVIKQGWNSLESIQDVELIPVRNLLPVDALLFSSSRWSKNQAAGISYENSGKTVICTTDETNLRPFLSLSHGGFLTLTIGNYYVFGFDVELVSGAPSQQFVTADGSFGRNSTSGRMACYFQATSATPILRLGLGVGGNEAAGKVAKFSNPYLYEATSLTEPPPHFYVPPKALQYFSKENENTLSPASVGANLKVVNEVVGSDVPDGYIPSVLTIVGVGDSFSNDTSEYPNLIAGQYPGISVWYNGVSGRTLSQMEVEATDTFTLSGVPINQYVKKGNPQVAIIQGGTNDTLGVTSPESIYTQLSTSMTAIESMISKAKSSGVKKIILTTVAPSSIFSDDQNEFVRLYNSWIRQHADKNNLGLCDINTILRDPANYNQLLALYDSGDNIHPSAAGETAIANGMVSAIRSLAFSENTNGGAMIQIAPGIYTAVN